MESEQITVVIQQKYMPLEMVNKLYGISISYLYKLRYQRKLFHYNLGKRTFIDIKELEELIKKGKKET
jgi:hypothetical protein